MKAFFATHFEKVILAISIVFAIYTFYVNITDMLTPPEGGTRKTL